MVDPVYFASIERLKGIMGFLQKLFGSHSDHELKRIYPIADKIEALEPQMQALSDEQLRAKLLSPSCPPTSTPLRARASTS